ncbi:transglutaminase-like cysteine peptidase [Alteromonas sp. Mac1]|uniref:transglutaminase-like cysteine peptidase n=1 Tax=Alteromonas sp. Mac1 TaxID=1777491 RepID=UPI000770458E|nr:transglutaminase-like cysteine peptidase [Alteromonas sp. Mac1]AMJ86448.1 transglutaminase [Alteromonas sp. Mac1]AMJ90307.1 transglutaminase [Alteromonas sp. Mac2]
MATRNACKNYRRTCIYALTGLFFGAASYVVAQQKNIFTPAVYSRVEALFGKNASSDVAKWRQLVANSQNEDIDEKLYQVNRFFNRFEFVDDLKHWRQPDYWATPIEFIATGAGDCEDYSIAKYFSLIELGIPESQLRLMYVTALELNQPHMVLAYYPSPTSIPLVLDNINRRILPANKRRDLAPVYSFNGEGLWAAKSMGTGRKLRGSGPMKMWDDMIDRLNSVMLGDTQEQ